MSSEKFDFNKEKNQPDLLDERLVEIKESNAGTEQLITQAANERVMALAEEKEKKRKRETALEERLAEDRKEKARQANRRIKAKNRKATR